MTRFLEEMRYFVSDEKEYDAWLGLLYQKGLEALRREIGNLPQGALKDDRSHLFARARTCGDPLLAETKESRRPSNLFLSLRRIPSEYRRPRKIFGLYPLMAPPIGTAILFYQAAILKGETERIERFFLFSVSIPDIGSMRERGHHATSLLGERMFDDPRLFGKYFFLKE